MAETLPLNENVENMRLKALGLIYASEFDAAEQLLVECNDDITAEIGGAYESHSFSSTTLFEIHEALIDRTWGHSLWRRAIAETSHVQALKYIEDGRKKVNLAKGGLVGFAVGKSTPWVDGMKPINVIGRVKAELNKTYLVAGAMAVSQQLIDDSIYDQPVARVGQTDVWWAAASIGQSHSAEDNMVVGDLVAWTEFKNESATRFGQIMRFGGLTLRAEAMTDIENKLIIDNLHQL